MSTNSVNGDTALFAMMEVLASSSNTGEKDQLMLGKTYATAQFLSQLASVLGKMGNAVTIENFLKTYLAENSNGKGPLNPLMLALLNYTMTTATKDNAIIDALNADIAQCETNMKNFADSHSTNFSYWVKNAPWYVAMWGASAILAYAGAMVLKNQKAIGDYDAKQSNQIKNDSNLLGPAMKAATLDMNRISSAMGIQGQKDSTLSEAQIKQDAHEVDASMAIFSSYSNICGSNNPNAPTTGN